MYTVHVYIYMYTTLLHIIDTRQIRRITLNEFSFPKDVIYVAFTNSKKLITDEFFAT